MRAHFHAMRSMTDVERRDHAKAEYIAARREIRRSGDRKEIDRITAQSKARIRALYSGSGDAGHDVQLLVELIDYVREIRLLSDLKD